MDDTPIIQEPPIDDLNPDEYGPAHPDDLIPLTPNEKPFTVLLFDPDSAFAGSGALQATALVTIHAKTPEDAGINAILSARSAGRGTAWRYPEILFLTEGYHEDFGPGARRAVK